MEISVIVPMYNSESTIKACVESILQQQGVAEILLCDDGSTDNTAQLCQHLATLYPCIQYLSCPHQGPSAARNIGLQHAKGKLISFIDSDVYKRQIWECISFSRIGSTIIYQADQRRSAIDVNQSQYDKVFNDFRRSG